MPVLIEKGSDSEYTVNDMKKKLKELFKSTGFNIFLIFALAALVLWLTLKDDGDQVLGILSKVNVWGVVLIIGLMMFERLMLGWGLMLECRQTHPHYTLWQGFQNAYTSGLFCNITPGASGGQVAQGYLFRKQGIPVSHTVGILWLDFIVYQSTMTVFVLLLILLKFHYFYANYSQFFLVVLLGFAVSAGVIVFLWVLAQSPRFYTWLTTTGINIGHKLHIVKDRDATLAKLNDQLAAFAKEIVVLRTHKKMIALLVLENLGRLIIYYSVPYFCAMALNIPVTPDMLLNIIALSSFVAMINAFLPMPGSSGGTEATFVLMFSTIFGKVDATSIMILWRLVTFYQTLIIGGIVFMYAKTRPDIPISSEEEHMPRTYAPEAIGENGENEKETETV